MVNNSCVTGLYKRHAAPSLTPKQWCAETTNTLSHDRHLQIFLRYANLREVTVISLETALKGHLDRANY